MVTRGDDSDGYADIGTVTLASVSPVLGGGELTALHMALELSRRVPVRILGAPGDPLFERARAAGVPTRSLSIGRKLGRQTALSNLLRYPGARRRLQQAVGEATTEGWCLLQYKWEELLWGGEVAPERVALWEHGGVPAALLRVPWARRRVRRAFEAAAVVFAWSAPAAASVAELSGREAIRLEHGVDAGAARRAASTRGELRVSLHLPGDAPVLAFVGRVVEDKGVITAVESLVGMPRAHLVVCGEGPATGAVRDTAARLGVGDRLHMLGHVERPLEVLAAADLSVLLTRIPGEGRPLAAIESLAVATPVLGTGSSPAMRALAHYDGVTLVGDSAPAAIAEAVDTILTRPRPPAVIPHWATAAEAFLAGLRHASGSSPTAPVAARW